MTITFRIITYYNNFSGVLQAEWSLSVIPFVIIAKKQYISSQNCRQLTWKLPSELMDIVVARDICLQGDIKYGLWRWLVQGEVQATDLFFA